MTALRERVLEALAEVAADLHTAGIGSSPNPAEVPVPGAWLNPREIELTSLDGSTGTATVDVWLVVPNTYTRLQAVGVLLDMVSAALRVPLVPTEPVDLDSPLSLPDNPNLPAASLTVELDI